jgi:hypothetical protein
MVNINNKRWPIVSTYIGKTGDNMLNDHKLRAEYKEKRKLLGITGEYSPKMPEKPLSIGYLAIGILILAIGIILLLNGCAWASSEEIRMDIISQIESNNNANAFNSGSGAIGLCQITPIVLKEYNQIWGKKFDRQYLFNGQFNLQVADWYMNHRIPYLLKHFHQVDTLENRLLAYNMGIRAVIKHKMCKESRNYILKYKQLKRG